MKTKCTNKLNKTASLYLLIGSTFSTISTQTHSANEFVEPGALPSSSYTSSSATGVSDDGSVIVGISYTGSNNFGFRWENGLMTDLGSLSIQLSNWSNATDLSADGSVVVGYSQNTPGNYEAFRWESGVMTGLGTLLQSPTIDRNGGWSIALGVSADGLVVVGSSSIANNVQKAFRWESGSMSDLGTLSGGTESSATAVSGNGSVVAGWSTNSNAAYEAFRWESNIMTGLGNLTGSASGYSQAYDISYDGSVIVGESRNASGDYEAFRWESNVMTGLGILSGFDSSTAKAVSGDGLVVVGDNMDFNTFTFKAFRWTQATGMQAVEEWLSAAGVAIGGWTALSSATGTNTDGSIVVGTGTNANGDREAYIARADAAVDGSSGIVGVTDLSNSLASQVSSHHTLEALTSMTLTGAHHRPLMDIAMSDGKHCGWVSADLGRVYRNGKGWTSLTEVGGCHDFADSAIRAGLGIGHSRASINHALNSESSLNGEYLLAELDWNIPNTTLTASVLAMAGRWNANLNRGYSSGTSRSKGNTDLQSASLRARVDWNNAFSLGAVSFSPSAQYTHTNTHIDGYQETGGTAAARFDSQNNNAKESRLALQGAYALDEKTTLLGRTEWAHRFDSEAAGVSGEANVLNALSMPFNTQGNNVRRDWVRIGAEVIHAYNHMGRLSVSANAASAGQDADLSLGVNWNMAF
jgi:probable HAF family extracellular repeat protein